MKTFAPVLLALLLGGTAAQADKITRSVGSDGVTKISIHGEGTGKVRTAPSQAPSTEAKPFQVYELESSSAPPAETTRTPVVIVVSSPPPIAPNPATQGYDYRYGYGYGYDYAYPSYRHSRRPICPPPTQHRSHYGPVNYQNPPVNYQNRPVNYQSRPVNSRPRPVQRRLR